MRLGEVRVIVCQKAISVRIEFPELRKKEENINRKKSVSIATANTWTNFWVGCCDSRTAGVVRRGKYSLGWALPLACDGNGSWQPIRPLPSNRALTFVHAQSTVRFNGKNEFHSTLHALRSAVLLLLGAAFCVASKFPWMRKLVGSRYRKRLIHRLLLFFLSLHFPIGCHESKLQIVIEATRTFQ